MKDQIKAGIQPVATQVVSGTNLPTLSPEQSALIEQQVKEFDFIAISMSQIALLGNEAEVSLQKTLDSFLQKITEAENPKIFKLVQKLKESVNSQNLPELAENILDPKTNFLGKFLGFINKNALIKAKDEAFESVRALASSKTKSLVDIVNNMEQEFKKELVKLEKELQNMEQLKQAYAKEFKNFVVTAYAVQKFLEKAKKQVSEKQSSVAENDIVAQQNLRELESKLQALESRALALEGVMTRLPADQLVIQELQNAGFQTLLESYTTINSRFSSIKMTIITLNSALINKGVQRLEEEGATLDANLATIRNKVAKEVMTKAANAAGENRLAQANQIKSIVQSTNELMQIAEQAKVSNAEKFSQAKEIFTQARQELLSLKKVKK